MCEDRQAREQSRNNLAIEVLNKTGLLRLSAFGHSRLPTLYPGDILTIRREPLTAIHSGDVVLYTRGDRFFIHRNLGSVQTASGGALVTRGDSMPHVDEPVTPVELLGRVIHIERAGELKSVPPCTLLRRALGMLLGHSTRLRSIFLNLHKQQNASTQPEFVSGEVSR
jgi:hypothetical protein